MDVKLNSSTNALPPICYLMRAERELETALWGKKPRLNGNENEPTGIELGPGVD
jgi:hypothetical protein